MKILVLWRVKPDADVSAIGDLMVDEERFAWKMFLQDELREHYESDTPVPAISVLEMENVEAAKAALANLPINRAGYLEPEYYPLRPFANWEYLFADAEKVAHADA